MRICHCHAVSDREIHAACRSGARTVGQVAKCCGAGKSCGGCVSAIVEILEHAAAGLPAGSTRELPVAAE